MNNLYEILTNDDIVSSINDNLDYLVYIIPEIKYMIGFEHKNPHHHLDVWNHTLLALSNSENNFDLRIALLFHDIGKPFSFQESNGIRHFNGHPLKSSEITKEVLQRLGFNKEYIEKICFYIKYHDSRIYDSLISDEDKIFFYKMQMCDALAHNPDKLSKRLEYLNKVQKKLKII